MSVVLKFEILVDVGEEEVSVVLREHDVDVVRLNADSDMVSHLRGVNSLAHDLILAGEHGDLIVHSLEDHGVHDALDGSQLGLCQLHILRPYDRRDVRSFLVVVHALELAAAESRAELARHHSIENIALTDKVGDKSILRLIVDVLGRAYLLDPALVHDDDLVGHRECLFLVMRDIDEGDAQLVVHILELDLHLLAHLEVQRAKRLIQKQDLRLIDQRSRDCDTLLLTAGKRADASLLKSLQIYQVQDPAHLALDDILGHLLLLEPESDIIVDIHMRKQSVPLEDRVDRSLVGRQILDRLPV